MFPDVLINEGFLVSFFGSMNSQRIMNTFMYYTQSVSGTPRALDDYYVDFLADTTFVQLKNSFLACLSQEYRLNYVRIQNVAPQRYVGLNVDFEEDGGLVAGNITQNVSVSITRQGVIADRHNNGGIRLVAPAYETWINGGEITATYKALLDDLADNMLLDIVTTSGGSNITARPCLYYFVPPSTDVFRPLFDTTVQNTVRTMHRRTKGIGI